MSLKERFPNFSYDSRNLGLITLLRGINRNHGLVTLTSPNIHYARNLPFSFIKIGWYQRLRCSKSQLGLLGFYEELKWIISTIYAPAIGFRKKRHYNTKHETLYYVAGPSLLHTLTKTKNGERKVMDPLRRSTRHVLSVFFQRFKLESSSTVEEVPHLVLNYLNSPEVHAMPNDMLVENVKRCLELGASAISTCHISCRYYQ